jgi:CheY-like chemotaxis protein
VRDALEADGHSCRPPSAARPGIDAFAAALGTEHAFELVITDLGMPRIDGIAVVAAAIKEKSARTPIILLTGWGQRLLDEKDVPANVESCAEQAAAHWRCYAPPCSISRVRTIRRCDEIQYASRSLLPSGPGAVATTPSRIDSASNSTLPSSRRRGYTCVAMTCRRTAA